MDSSICANELFSTPAIRREGEYWTIEYGGIVCRLRDTVGIRHIAYLLSRPGERVRAADLVAVANRGAAISGRVAEDAAAASERARVNVTRAIRSALRRIGKHHPSLLWDLERTIRTGAYCSYAPPRASPATWLVEE